jgi:hypothetical protein
MTPLFQSRLAVLAKDDPLLEGVREIASELILDAQEESSRLGHSGDDRAFLDGRQSALRDFKGYLDTAWEQAHKLPEPPE